jgi:pilus assembly protein CpaC
MSLISSRLVKADELTFANAPIPQKLGTSKTDLIQPQKINPYKDNNEKLYGVIGKTQIIKFDEPVKRISITDPSLADLVLLSPTELLLNGKKPGRTSLLFWGDMDRPVFFNLIVQQDTDAFMQALDQVAPDEDIDFSLTDDGIIMSGHVSSTAVKKNINELIKAYNYKVLDLTESPTKQVLLEVKITEASRNFSRTLESQFSVGENYGSFVTDVLGVKNHLDLSNALFAPKTGGQYMYSSSSANIAWAIKAAEQKGYVKILAEPKLLAINGEAGSFNVGNEIPVPSGMGQYGNLSYSFKNTGVILNFTPTILEKSNRVILKLSPEVSEVDESYTSSSGIPGFKTRKVDTTVELADGETLIIAGLLKNTTSKSSSKIPWLGDLPVIGVLFSSITKKKDDVELVIFITPKIVEVDKNNRVSL